MTTTTVTDTQMAQLAINTIRTLSMDAVQAANSGHPGHADGARAAGLHALESGHALRPVGPDLAGPRPLRAFERPRFDVAVVGAPPTGHAGGECRLRAAGRAVGHARRHPPVPPARQQGSRASRVPPGLGCGDDDRAARPGHCDQRRHGDRRAMARRPLQPPGLRHVRLQHLRDLRRRLPDGRSQRGGGLTRGPPRPRSPLLDLR